MNSNLNLSVLRRTAAEIASLSLLEWYPNVVPLGGGPTSWGFYYDFSFPHPVHREFHLQLEERMRQIVREKREIHFFEMVPFSASELFKRHRLLHLAQEVLEQTELVQVVQIGSFFDLVSGEVLSNTEELSAFKVFPIEQIGESQIRILGVAYASKEELKKFLKQWAKYKEQCHEARGDVEGLWTVELGVRAWLAKGISFKEKLKDFFKKSLVDPDEGLQVQFVQSENRLAVYAKILEKKSIASVFQTLFLARQEEVGPAENCALFASVMEEYLEIAAQGSSGAASLRAGLAQSAKSLLHLIGKTLSMLSFNYSLVLVGSGRGEEKILLQALQELKREGDPKVSWEVERGSASRIDFLVPDGLGRLWSAVSVFVDTVHNLAVVQVPVERNVALLLEQQKPLALFFDKMR